MLNIRSLSKKLFGKSLKKFGFTDHSSFLEMLSSLLLLLVSLRLLENFGLWDDVDGIFSSIFLFLLEFDGLLCFITSPS